MPMNDKTHRVIILKPNNFLAVSHMRNEFALRATLFAKARLEYGLGTSWGDIP